MPLDVRRRPLCEQIRRRLGRASVAQYPQYFKVGTV